MCGRLTDYLRAECLASAPSSRPLEDDQCSSSRAVDDSRRASEFQGESGASDRTVRSSASACCSARAQSLSCTQVHTRLGLDRLVGADAGACGADGFVGPQASGVPTRIAEQNRRICSRVADGRAAGSPAADGAAARVAPWFVFAVMVSEDCAAAPFPADVTSIPSGCRCPPPRTGAPHAREA